LDLSLRDEGHSARDEVHGKLLATRSYPSAQVATIANVHLREFSRLPIQE
jgi:hypothetical protein